MFICFILILAALIGIFYAVRSFLIQKSWRENAENGNFIHVKNEPFPGALCLSAIIQSCISDSLFSARIMESVFGRHLDEWSAITKSVSDAKSLNRDLLVENLVSIIKKQKDEYKLKYLPLIFKALTAAEFLWNEKNQGEKPSVYLKSLLNYSLENDTETDAFRVLGLDPGSSIEKIRRAHRKLAARYHPDKSSAQGNLEMFLKIQTAYEILSKKYDTHM